jgi:hypothetical protein
MLSSQTVVHEPQWRESVVTSTQVPPQFWVPAAVHESTHWAALQTCSAVHWLPQVPQLVDSVWRSTQTEPQSVWPLGHALPEPPVPLPPCPVSPPVLGPEPPWPLVSPPLPSTCDPFPPLTESLASGEFSSPPDPAAVRASGLTVVAQVVTPRATPDPSSANSKNPQTFPIEL